MCVFDTVLSTVKGCTLHSTPFTTIDYTHNSDSGTAQARRRHNEATDT